MKSRSFNTRIQKLYLKSAAILLCLTASAKLIGLSHDTSFQNLNDSVFYFLTNRQLLLIVSALEIIVAGSVLLPTILIETKIISVFWLATLFSVYRFGLFLAKEPQPCKCLGDLLSWSNLSDDSIRLFTNAALIFLLLPPAYWLLKNSNRSKAPQNDVY
jgi:hypothetical protein